LIEPDLFGKPLHAFPDHAPGELQVECLIAAPTTCGIGGSLVPDAGFVAVQL
jgi:hypothetical protein